MNQLKSKSVQKLDIKFEINLNKKRKREDESFERIVVPKLTPSYDIESKKISISKISIPFLSISIKES